MPEEMDTKQWFQGLAAEMRNQGMEKQGAVVDEMIRLSEVVGNYMNANPHDFGKLIIPMMVQDVKATPVPDTDKVVWTAGVSVDTSTPGGAILSAILLGGVITIVAQAGT
jgi:hypothetical protein